MSYERTTRSEMQNNASGSNQFYARTGFSDQRPTTSHIAQLQSSMRTSTLHKQTHSLTQLMHNGAQQNVIQRVDGDQEENSGGGRSGIMGERIPGLIGEALNIISVVPTYLPENLRGPANIMAGVGLLTMAGYQFCTSKDGIETIQAGANASTAAAQTLQGVLQVVPGYETAASVVGYFPGLFWGMAEACNTLYNYNNYTPAMRAAGAVKAVGAAFSPIPVSGVTNTASAIAALGASIAAASHATEVIEECHHKKKQEAYEEIV